MKKLAMYLGLLGLVSAANAETVIFGNNFDDALPADINPGTATLTGVQDFAELGPTGNQFGENFLRSATGNIVTITLNNLPQHSAINIDFLFAAIDSLDGTGSFPSGDFFNVTVDGNSIFRESFANALPEQIQSYISAPDVELLRREEVGFSAGTYYNDSAYNFYLEPLFHNIAHTADSLVLTFQIEGVGIQDLNDESWAMDNLRISVAEVPVPPAAILLGSALTGLAGLRRR